MLFHQPVPRGVGRLSLIAGLFLGAAALGWLAGWQRFNAVKLLLVSLGAALALLLLIAWFRSARVEYGLLAVPLAAGLLNFLTLPTGTQSRVVLSLVLVMALVGFWLLQQLAVQRRLRLVPSALNRPVIMFVAVNAVALIWGWLLRDPLVQVWDTFAFVQAAALAVNVLLPVAALLVVNWLREVIWLKRLTWIVIGLGALAVSALIFNWPALRLIENGSRGLFPMWVAALSYAQVLFNRGLPRLARVGLLVLLAALAWYFFGMRPNWLSGWLPILAACAVVTALHSRRLLLVGALAVAVFLAANYQTLYDRIVVANVNEGGLERLELWQRSLQLIGRHPLFGVGPAGYAVYYMTYHPDDARSTHNNYFDVVSQVGVVGLAVFLWIFAVLVRQGVQLVRALKRSPSFESGFAVAALAGCVGALGAMMLGDWVLPFAYNQTISGFDNAIFTWLCLGALASLHHIVLGPPP